MPEYRNPPKNCGMCLDPVRSTFEPSLLCGGAIPVDAVAQLHLAGFLLARYGQPRPIPMVSDGVGSSVFLRMKDTEFVLANAVVSGNAYELRIGELQSAGALTANGCAVLGELTSLGILINASMLEYVNGMLTVSYCAGIFAWDDARWPDVNEWSGGLLFENVNYTPMGVCSFATGCTVTPV